MLNFNDDNVATLLLKGGELTNPSESFRLGIPENYGEDIPGLILMRGAAYKIGLRSKSKLNLHKLIANFHTMGSMYDTAYDVVYKPKAETDAEHVLASGGCVGTSDMTRSMLRGSGFTQINVASLTGSILMGFHKHGIGTVVAQHFEYDPFLFDNNGIPEKVDYQNVMLFSDSVSPSSHAAIAAYHLRCYLAKLMSDLDQAEKNGSVKNVSGRPLSAKKKKLIQDTIHRLLVVDFDFKGFNDICDKVRKSIVMVLTALNRPTALASYHIIAK